jgi:pyruvate formate lyase activating enzyme
MKRRNFLISAAIGGGLAICPGLITREIKASPENESPLTDNHHPARYFKKLEHGIIECELCPRRCRVSDLERGYCGVRENISGDYYTLVYNRVCSANVDPIEKKPFFHFLPGTDAFSIATAGCNLNCKFCQNWSISQFRPEDVKHHDMPSSKVAEIAKANDCHSIAYTYSEPTIFYEYMYDCAAEAKNKGIRSTVVSAGYIEKQPLLDLLPMVDAIKIDLKAFSESYYKDVVNGKLEPVLDTLVTIKEQGRWLEIVYLMLPGMNDSEKEITELSKWVTANLGKDVPIHFTRFHPSYLMQNVPITPLNVLERAYTIARTEGIHYPYIGNVYGHDAENTYCHSCGDLLIGRKGFQISTNKIKTGKCPSCKTDIPGVWS